MATPDLPLICRIAIEDGRADETLLDAAQRVCRANYGDRADAAFALLLQAVEQEMAKGVPGPDAAIARLADTEAPTPPPRRPWWRYWG